MRRPRDPREVGFEPIDPRPQADELPSKRSIRPVGGVPGEDRIDRSVQEGTVVRIDRQIVEYSNHSKDLPSQHENWLSAPERETIKQQANV